MNDATYKVNGMTCGGCASSLKKAISVKDPTATIEVDLKAALVTVNTVLDAAGIKNVVERAGFEFEGAVS